MMRADESPWSDWVTIGTFVAMLLSVGIALAAWFA